MPRRILDPVGEARGGLCWREPRAFCAGPVIPRQSTPAPPLYSIAAVHEVPDELGRREPTRFICTFTGSIYGRRQPAANRPAPGVLRPTVIGRAFRKPGCTGIALILRLHDSTPCSPAGCTPGDLSRLALASLLEEVQQISINLIRLSGGDAMRSAGIVDCLGVRNQLDGLL
jgi:hypothetical protein